MTQAADEAFAAHVREQLDVIEHRLLQEAIGDSRFVTDAAQHIIAAGGKRFRPLLVLAASHFGQHANLDDLISAAVVVELTHVASLYHDDVMDEAELRRGTPSANIAFGNSNAILIGDFLFAAASREVAKLGVDYVRLQAETFSRLVQGQIAETLGPEPGADPLTHYYEVIEGKTAALIETSAVFGAMVSGASADVVDSMRGYGFEIGMAFQLSDDLIDITSDVTGKTPGTDLREGVATLPTLLLLDSQDPADDHLQKLIRAGLASEDAVDAALAGLRVHPVIKQAQDVVRQRAEQARSHLQHLPDGPAKQALSQLCDDMANRSA